MPTVSRLSRTKLVTSVTAPLRSAHRAADLSGIVGQRRGHGREVLVELAQQVTAVMQSRCQCGQVLDGPEQVGGVVAQDRHRLRQILQRVANVRTLTTQVVGQRVDELPGGGNPTRLGGLQGLVQLVQLCFQIVPLHRHRGALLRDDCVVLQSRPAGVHRAQLQRTRRDDRGRQDQRLSVGRDLVLVVDPEVDPRAVRLRLDRLDLADLHPEDAHLVAGVDALAVLEVGGQPGLADPRHRPECTTRPAATRTARKSASAIRAPRVFDHEPAP